MRQIMKKTRNNHDGFTLIELALVITVLGLIVAPLFGFIATQVKKEKDVIAQNREKTIITALSLYIKQNNRYPCPANPSLAPGQPQFGRESRAGAACNGVPNPGVSPLPTAVISSGGANPVFSGALPTHALNLPQRYAANAAGMKYIYAVTGSLADATTFATATGQIRINDAAGNQMTNDLAHFVIIDTGRNRLGGYNLDANIRTFACTGGGLDVENCDADNVYRDALFSLSQAGGNYFDDTVYFTLLREDSTFWSVDYSSSAGTLDVTNRNLGNVGIGNQQPDEKLHVTDGNIRVQDGNIISDTEIRSPVFVYE